MSTSSVFERRTESPAQTEALGEQLGAACRGGELLVLAGELGAGKTVLVRGLARGLGCDPTSVRSPSYTLLQSYPGRRTLHHFDVYFTEAAIDLERSMLRDSLAAGDVAVVEWGERFLADLPADHLRITLEHAGPERRRVRLEPGGEAGRGLLARAGLSAGPTA